MLRLKSDSFYSPVSQLVWHVLMFTHHKLPLESQTLNVFFFFDTERNLKSLSVSFGSFSFQVSTLGSFYPSFYLFMRQQNHVYNCKFPITNRRCSRPTFMYLLFNFTLEVELTGWWMSCKVCLQWVQFHWTDGSWVNQAVVWVIVVNWHSLGLCTMNTPYHWWDWVSADGDQGGVNYLYHIMVQIRSGPPDHYWN